MHINFDKKKKAICQILLLHDISQLGARLWVEVNQNFRIEHNFVITFKIKYIFL